MRKKILGIFTVGILAGPMAANAGLIGETITGTGSNLSPTVATIGPGVEFPNPSVITSFDFDDDTVTIDNAWSSSPYTGAYGYNVYTFSGFVSEIISLSLVSNTGWAGTFVEPGGYWFTSDSVSFDFSSSPSNFVQAGAQAIFSIETRSESIPEPATLALLGFGLAGIGFARKKKQS